VQQIQTIMHEVAHALVRQGFVTMPAMFPAVRHGDIFAGIIGGKGNCIRLYQQESIAKTYT
jgi:hypothetical protein